MSQPDAIAQRRSRRELIVTTVITAGVVSFVLFTVMREGWIAGWLLYDGRPGPGLVTAKRDHGHRVYQYTVEHQRYTGDDQPLYNANEPELPYETTVHFSGSRPWISGLRTGETRVGQVPLFLMVLIFASGWAMSLFTQKFLRWRAAQRKHPTQGPQPAPSENGRLGDDPVLRLWLPAGRSRWAIAAGYMGLFAMFCVSAIADIQQGLPGCIAVFALLCLPAPLAIVLGAAAIADLRRKPQLHGWGRAVFGLVMGTIFTMVLISSTSCTLVPP